MMRNFLFILMLLGFSLGVQAQGNIEVTGVVTDGNKEPMIGVNISIQNMPGLGVITDIMVSIQLRCLLTINWSFRILDTRPKRFW